MAEVDTLTRGLRESTWELGEGWGQHDSGLFVPPSAPRRSRPVALDLFCGAGGFSLGLIAAGFDVIAGVDASPDCMMSYLYNLGAYPVNGTCNTLKRSLLATSGAGAVMRGRSTPNGKQPKPKAQKAQAVTVESSAAQQSLWEAVAS